MNKHAALTWARFDCFAVSFIVGRWELNCRLRVTERASFANFERPTIWIECDSFWLILIDNLKATNLLCCLQNRWVAWGRWCHEMSGGREQPNRVRCESAPPEVAAIMVFLYQIIQIINYGENFDNFLAKLEKNCWSLALWQYDLLVMEESFHLHSPRRA